ncbi:hypothetical protein CRYUN_Cryun36dG0092200 [Craigia yunnanensis]
MEMYAHFQPIMQGENFTNSEGEIKVSFGYQCNSHKGIPCSAANGCEIRWGNEMPRTGSFSCLSGAALSANATLANTNIYNGLIGAEILPSLDSPNSFRRVPSSPSLSRLDILSSSLQSTMSNLSCSPPSPVDSPETDSYLLTPMSAPSRSDSFLNAMEVQVAGGAADWESKLDVPRASNCMDANGPFEYFLDDGTVGNDAKTASRVDSKKYASAESFMKKTADPKMEVLSDSFRHGVLDSLQRALSQAESDFLYMVEQEMENRPDLV